MSDDLAGDLRLALRQLARSVFIISTRDGARRFAMAATAVTELSMDPPSMLICINRAASFHAPLASAGRFCINLLHRGHAALATACGGGAKGEARFSDGQWGETDGLPFLEDAVANLFCRVDRTLSYGTHGLFIGAVTQIRIHGTADPLIYADGGYRMLGGGDERHPMRTGAEIRTIPRI